MRRRACVLVLALLVSSVAPGQEPALVPEGATWRWLVGTAEPPADWTSTGFDDSSWAQGPAGFGYGDGDDRTELTSMKGRATTVYLRHGFHVGSRAGPLMLAVRVDDGFVAWLDGVEIARAGVADAAPRHDAVALDHEAGTFEEHPLGDLRLAPGRHVLAILAANSARDSSDLSIDARLTVAAQAPQEGAPEKPMRRVRWSTTFALDGHTNVFQGRAGSPEISVLGQVLRQEVELRLGTKRACELSLGLEGRRVGHLGEETGAWARVALELPRRQRLRAGLATRWNRPAYQVGTALGRTDALDLSLAWSIDAAPEDAASQPRLRLGAWTSLLREDTGLDPRRSGNDVDVGGSVRWLQPRRASPELGLERSWRAARSDNLDAAQWRAFLRVSSALGRRTSLSFMAREGWRAYTTSNRALSNFRRHDRRHLVRASATWRIDESWRVDVTLSRESGTSSGEDAGFDSTGAWAGATWSAR